MLFVNSVLHWLGMIPVTFWGVVFGSFFTILGVVLSNRANSNRLGTQLAHDAKLKKVERDLTLKKDIFLKAIEALAIGCNCVGRFTNLEAQASTLEEDYTARSASVVQVSLVGDSNTIEAVEEVTQAIVSAMIRLHSKRLPLVLEKGKAEIHRGLIKQANIEVTGLLEQMKAHNIAGDTDTGKFARLQDQFAIINNQIKKDHELACEFENNVQVELFRLTLDVTDDLAAIARTFPKALSSMRIELGLPLNESRFLALIERSLAAQKAAVSAALSDIGDTLKTSAKQSLES